MHTDIVVGVDASRGSEAALAWALDDASRRQVQVRAVLALADDGRPAAVDAAAASPALTDLAAAASTALRCAVAAARPRGAAALRQVATPIKERVAYSDPAHALLQESLSAGLLVLGAQRRGTSRWTLPGTLGPAGPGRSNRDLPRLAAHSHRRRALANWQIRACSREKTPVSTKGR
jgi:nucleotide-binding universal stress UspA family protein